jgi:SNF2 family DNA or RNA helicase
VLRTSLNHSQLEAVAKARPYSGFAFFSEQRTGKSLAALAVADERRPPALLIVCPPGAIKVWQGQLKEHTPEDWGIDTYIESTGKVWRNRHAWKDWLKANPGVMVVLDEAHRAKKRGSQISKAARLLGKYAAIRLALTGTPIAQGIQDAWALFDFIQPGVFGTYLEFEERYLRVANITTEENSWKKIRGPKPEMLPEFNRIYHKYVYRITLNEARRKAGKKGIKFRRIKVQVELEPQARQLYKELKKDLEADFQGNFFSVDTTLAKAIKLQQICGGFAKDEDGEWRQIGHSKLRALLETLKLCRGKVVVVCRFIPEIEAIEAMLIAHGKSVLVIRGGQPYQGEFNADVVIIQVQAGVAIDLSEAEIIIFYSCDYSYIDYEQIRYRIRSYDTSQVTEYFLICTKTIDELVYRAVTQKKKFADLINEEFRRRYDVQPRSVSTTG